MTRFIDGPAAGAALMLKRAPEFVRIVQDEKGEFDGLDLLTDTPDADEKIFAYRLKEHRGTCHIYKRGPGSGFYPIANYEFVNPQPTDAEMRDTNAWRKWTCNAGRMA